MENKQQGSSSTQKAENNPPSTQDYRKMLFDQLNAGVIDVGYQDLLLGEMTQTTPALAPMVNDDQMQTDDHLMQSNNLVQTGAPEVQLFDFDFGFQNYQLPNESEEEMVDRLLDHVEHMSRDFDRIHDEFHQQCAEFEEEFQRLGYLFRGLGDGTAEFEVDIIGDDQDGSEEVNMGEVGGGEMEAMEEEVIMSSGLAEEEIQENLNGADFRPPSEIHQHHRQDMCCICLGAYEEGEEKRKVGCGHMFHYDCIRKWLLRKNSCPLCNRPVFRLH